MTGFRLLSWAFVWLSAVVFGWGLLRHFQMLFPAARFRWPVFVALALLASAAVYTIKPAALTYNSLNFVAVCIALGLFLSGVARLIAPPSSPSWRGVVEIALAAAVATVDVLVKPTTAVYVLACIGGYCAVCPALPWQAKKRLGLVAVAAGGVGLVAMIVVVGGIGGFMTRVSTLTSILQNRSFMEELNTRTVREFGEIGTFLLGDLRHAAIALGVGGLLVACLRRSEINARRTAVVVGGVAWALWLYATVRAGLWRGSHGLYFEGIVARLYLGAALLTGAAAVVSWAVIPAASRQRMSGGQPLLKLLVWGILMTVPFAGAYGSTTSVYLNGALYSICWLAAALLAVAELMRVWGTRLIFPAVAVPMAVYAVAQLVHGQIIMPYMYPRPLWENTVPTAIGAEGNELLVDPDTSQVITTTREILTRHGFKAGDDIFCFFNVPGLVYAVGGRSPVIPWYFGRIYVGNPVEEYHMQAAGPERRANAWIITQADVEQFREHFVRGGINFPEGYEQIGTLKNHQSGLPLGIWKPRTRQ